MTKDETDVLAAYQKMQKAMIDKDLETMRSLVSEDRIFTHMSGKKQTREQFFGEIMDGTLNYYRSEIKNPRITVNNGCANLKAAVTLKARVYGMSGSWTLSTDTNFRKINGEWIQVN
jgi:hypothetical protein